MFQIAFSCYCSSSFLFEPSPLNVQQEVVTFCNLFLPCLVILSGFMWEFLKSFLPFSFFFFVSVYCYSDLLGVSKVHQHIYTYSPAVPYKAAKKLKIFLSFFIHSARLSVPLSPIRQAFEALKLAVTPHVCRVNCYEPMATFPSLRHYSQ